LLILQLLHWDRALRLPIIRRTNAWGGGGGEGGEGGGRERLNHALEWEPPKSRIWKASPRPSEKVAFPSENQFPFEKNWESKFLFGRFRMFFVSMLNHPLHLTAHRYPSRNFLLLDGKDYEKINSRCPG